MPEREGSDWVRYAVARRSRGIEFLRAHFSAHAYERHSHESYAIGVTEAGAQAFHCRGAHHVSSARMVMAFNPDEAHDGHAADTASGFTYRMLYLDPALVRGVVEDWREGDGGAGALPFSRAPVIADPMLARLVLALHEALAEEAPRLEQEAHLADLVACFASRHAAMAPPRNPAGARPGESALDRVRSYLHETPLAEDIATETLAALAGMSRFRLCRHFARAYGLPPHAYRLQRRLAAAKRLLGEGEPPAAVAAALGFADQSHFHKRFKGAFGITPGRFTAAAK